MEGMELEGRKEIKETKARKERKANKQTDRRTNRQTGNIYIPFVA